MTNSNDYKVYAVDDHQGNKFLLVSKGNWNKAIENGRGIKITDSRFNNIKQRLINILEHTGAYIDTNKL